jgi:hypothetical protein
MDLTLAATVKSGCARAEFLTMPVREFLRVIKKMGKPA